ncbi:MAG: TPM domain-containing protein [Cyanobacteria bacterium]|nr:TPM domain-containing protein [Cyanobacteriota bacterium]
METGFVARPLGQLKQGEIRFGKRAKTPQLNQKTDLPPQNSSRINASWLRRFSLPAIISAASFLGPLSIPSTALAQNAPNTSASHPADIDELSHPKINRASDLPNVNQQMTQITVDLARSPLLSPSARGQLEQFLQRFYDNGDGEFKVIIIPNTDLDKLRELNLNLFNQLKLGKKGKDDGALFFMVADRIRNNQRASWTFQPGDGIQHLFENSPIPQQVKDQANIHLSAALAAKQNGDMVTAQRETDAFVLNSVQLIANHISQYNQAHRPKTPAEQAKAAEETKNALLLILAILAGVGAVGGVSVLAVMARNKKKRLEADLKTISTPLIQMNSSHKVTTGNLYSLKTLNALLEPKPEKPADGNAIKAAASRVLDFLGFTVSRLGHKSKDPTFDRGQIKTALRDKALSHPSPIIRQWAAGLLNGVNYGKLDRTSDFEPLMTQLEKETDPKVAVALQKTASDLITEADYSRFESMLDNPLAENRVFAVAQLLENPQASLMGKLFARLANPQETDATVVKALKDGIIALAKNKELKATTGPLLLEKAMINPPTPVVITALEGIAAMGDNAHFNPLFTDWQKKPTSVIADTEYSRAMIKALSATVNASHLPSIHPDLNYQNPRRLATALTLIRQVGSPTSAKPLWDFIGDPETPIEYAIQSAEPVLNDVLNQDFHPTLLSTIQNPGDRFSARLYAAVIGLGKVGSSSDVDDLFALSEKPVAYTAQHHLEHTLERLVSGNENFGFISGKVATGKTTESRQLAIRLLAKYGDQALPQLFNALRHSTQSTPSGEVDALTGAIIRLASGRNFDTFSAEAVDENPRVQETATTGALSVLSDWGRSADYDKSQDRQRCAELKRHRNARIAQKAGQIYNKMVEDKRQEIARVGSQGNFHDSGTYSTLKGIKQGGQWDPILVTAAVTALAELASRQQAWEIAEAARKRREAEEAERRREEEAARRRRQQEDDDRRSSSSSSSSWGSSSSGGGFSSGGGGSSGGGSFGND